MFKFPILRTLILYVKQSVKHIVPIDNVIRIHILMYSLIVIGHDAYVEHGTASQPHHSCSFKDSTELLLHTHMS